VVIKFDGPDLNDPVAAFWVKAGGFGIENDLTHEAGSF
jgi:hypothetical protein